MKSIDQQLQDDSRRIRAQVPPALANRLHNTLASTEPGNLTPTLFPGRWPRVAAGLALGIMAAVVILMWGGRNEPGKSVPTVAVIAETGSDAAARVGLGFLGVDSQAPEAELQVELQRLASDWQRIRSGVRKQFDPILSGG